jgi:hypothetical protein
LRHSMEKMVGHSFCCYFYNPFHFFQCTFNIMI